MSHDSKLDAAAKRWLESPTDVLRGRLKANVARRLGYWFGSRPVYIMGYGAPRQLQKRMLAGGHGAGEREKARRRRSAAYPGCTTRRDDTIQ